MNNATTTPRDPGDTALLALRAAFLSMVTEKGLDDLSLRQLAVLLTLRQAATGVTVRRLAGYLGVHKPAISQAMNRLVLQKLAKRKPDPADGRSVLLEITRRGVMLADRMAEAMKSAS